MSKNNRRRIRPAVATTVSAEIDIGATPIPALSKPHVRFCGCAACKPKPVKPVKVKKEGLS